MNETHGRPAGPPEGRLFWLYASAFARVMSWKAALALGLMVCLGLTEGIGLLMLVPLLALVGLDVQHGAVGRIAQLLSSGFGAVGVQPTLVMVLGIYVLVISAHGLLFRWQTTVNLALEHEFVAALRNRLYRAIVNAEWLFLSRSRAADFVHVLTAEVERVGAATSCFLHSFVVSFVALVYVLFALRLSAVMTGVALAGGAGLTLLLKGKTREAHATGEGLSRAMQSFYAALLEHLGGMKTAKSYGAEERHAALFAKLTEEVRHLYVSAVRNQSDVRYWFDTGSVLLLSLIVYVSLEVLAIPTAELLLLLFVFARIMPRLSSIQQNYQSFVNLLPAFASVIEMQARCEAASEREPRGTEQVELRHGVRLDRVSFRYDELPVIRDLDLACHAGETTVIVGPSGSGKSTVADLIMGLVVPDEGRVLVDSVPLAPERVRPWRERIGYVAQETFLFHDTVRANLLWARPEATEDEVCQALRLAGAEEFVSRLPRGVDTLVGDRGVLLSGGERQRLALARALLRRPSLLILDEATSAVDSENEQRIQRALGNLRGNMTILVISHRLSTVREADVIHVLEEGRLVESGSWETLITSEDGRFRALCRAQGIQTEEHIQL